MPDPVEIIVVTYNSRRHFPRLRAALEAQTHAFTLVVVDNASAPDERPCAGDLPAGATILQLDSNTGFAGGNNLAARRGTGTWIALLNPDAFPEPDWLARLVAATVRWPEAAAFGSTQVSADDPARYDGLGDAYHVIGAPWRGGFGALRTTPPVEGETFSPCAAAALYRRDAWKAAGGFEERFFCFGEDVDLGFRLRLAGHQCVQVAGAVVHHVGGASASRRSDFATYHGRRNRLWTFVKCMPSPLFELALPFHAGLTALTLLATLGKPTFAPTWRALRDGMRGLPDILRTRREIQRARKARLGDIMGALSWSPLALLTRPPVIRRKR